MSRVPVYFYALAYLSLRCVHVHYDGHAQEAIVLHGKCLAWHGTLLEGLCYGWPRLTVRLPFCCLYVLVSLFLCCHAQKSSTLSVVLSTKLAVRTYFTHANNTIADPGMSRQYRRYGMAPANITAFLSQKPT